jgi:hypothetical protein
VTAQFKRMNDEDFVKVFEQNPEALPEIAIDPTSEKLEWLLYGPKGVYYGIYCHPDGACAVSDLSVLHRLLNGWGFKKFLQEGSLKEFA